MELEHLRRHMIEHLNQLGGREVESLETCDGRHGPLICLSIRANTLEILDNLRTHAWSDTATGSNERTTYAMFNSPKIV